MGPAVLKATKNAMVHLDIVEAKTFGRCHCNSTSVLFYLFGKTGELRSWVASSCPYLGGEVV